MRRSKGTRVLALTLLLGLTMSEAVWGWPWNTDMFWHQSIRRQEIPSLAPPDGTLAMDQEPPLTRDEMRDAPNPVAPTPESLARGRERFDTLCFPCHGTKGLGDGPVSKKFVTPANLTLERYRQMTDGYISGTIRNGGSNMPPQGTALYAAERWDVVNYVRSLQKP